MEMDDEVKFSTLMGRTLARVENVRGEEIHFETVDGETFRLFHNQNCCENVRVEEVVGDLADLVGSPITMADEATNAGETPMSLNPPDAESYTWTFYRLATVKGYVTIRFLGTSNGYYGEGVDFVKDERPTSNESGV